MKRLALPLVAVLALGACATVPAGPTVMVLPGNGKPFDQFQVDDAQCRRWAFGQSGAEAPSSSGQSVLTGAVVGTIIGGAAGAALGAIGGNPGLGAAVGAGFGAVGGTATGASAGSLDSYTMQRRYDVAYQQCMYARGNQIPGIRSGTTSYVPPPPPRAGQYVPAPPPGAVGPPPGTPPPPGVSAPPPPTTTPK